MVFKGRNIDIWENKLAVDLYSTPAPHLLHLEKEQLSFFKSGSSVLDLGCGTGRTTSILNEMGFKVLGIDYSESMISCAKQLHPKLDFSVMDGAKLDFPDNHFDNVFFSFNGIDYIYPEERRIKAFNEIFRVLGPGGFFAFTSHNAWMIPYGKRRFIHFLRNFIKCRCFSRYRWDYQQFGTLLTCYVSLQRQKKVLSEAGFISIKVLGGKKYRNIFMAMFLDPHICYICKKLCDK